MSALVELLRECGVDLEDEVVVLAIGNYRSERGLLNTLRQTRERRRLSVQTVAARMGVSTATVWAIEEWDADPTTAQLRRYANAIGATYEHTVTGASERPGE